MKASSLLLLLSLGVWLLVPTWGLAQSPAVDKAETKVSGSGRDFLKALAGSWEGTCTTWLESSTPSDESKIKGEIKLIFADRLIRHTYEGTMKGKPRHGEETIAWNGITKKYQVSWMDTFHMRASILFSEGESTNGGLIVKGKWETGPNEPSWGWNTVYNLVDADHLTITAYVVKPDGVEKKAVQTKYTRVKK